MDVIQLKNQVGDRLAYMPGCHITADTLLKAIMLPCVCSSAQVQLMGCMTSFVSSSLLRGPWMASRDAAVIPIPVASTTFLGLLTLAPPGTGRATR